MSLRQNSPVSFRQALLRSDKIKLIAEIKKQSPSAGIIRADFDPAELAKTYEKAGASAISVLTDQKFFGGSIEDLKKVKAACSLPVIQKDFIIDEKQIHQAKAAGADAILLIVKVLGLEKTIEFLKITRELGMDALVETHNSDEVEFAFMAGAEIIGVNNRDLKVFRVDFKNTLNLINKYPDLKDRILVSESGIKHTKHVKQLHQAGVSAILVGESLLRAKDIAAKIAELLEN
ncbi:MAG: indole-3-glycerol phosphate synthase TrpC [Candidatus Saganbacteria bacterium]|nr:indole-3-glycerol phosphate synthase TrpC [Candidatus Saganbacteria bacterium]